MITGLSPLRWVQLLTCFAVAYCTVLIANRTTEPVLHLGPMLFPAQEAPPATTLDITELGALTVPGMELVEVIVQRDDTLDHIFRRLRLSLTDLADVRALSGVQSMLDRLNPGERLKFLHRDAALIGLERHLSLTEELEVRRTDDGFKATVVPKPVEIHTDLARGVIESSLFESANSAGLSDSSVLKLAKIFGSDIDFVLGLREGDQFVVNYERILQNGHYVKDGDILAARFVNQGRVYEAGGETIGYVGMTGLATGPHLHFEYRVNGQYVDPQKIKLPDARPIDPNLYDDFKQHSLPLLAVLQP